MALQRSATTTWICVGLNSVSSGWDQKRNTKDIHHRDVLCNMVETLMRIPV